MAAMKGSRGARPLVQAAKVADPRAAIREVEKRILEPVRRDREKMTASPLGPVFISDLAPLQLGGVLTDAQARQGDHQERRSGLVLAVFHQTPDFLDGLDDGVLLIRSFPVRSEFRDRHAHADPLGVGLGVCPGPLERLFASQIAPDHNVLVASDRVDDVDGLHL